MLRHGSYCTWQTTSRQIVFPVFQGERRDQSQFRPLLFIQPTVAFNSRVVQAAQFFIQMVQQRLLLKRKVLALWRRFRTRAALRVAFGRWRNGLTVNQQLLRIHQLRRYFEAWLNRTWDRRATRSVLRRSVATLRENTVRLRAEKGLLRKAEAHNRHQLLQNHLSALLRLTQQRQKAQHFFLYTAVQMQTTFLSVYLNQDSYRDVRVATTLATLVNHVNQSPFFYLLRPAKPYLSLLSRCTVAMRAVEASVSKWLTTATTQQDARPAHNFQYTLKKNQKNEKGYLLLQNRFLSTTGETGAYVILVHLRACLAQMQTLLPPPTEVDERYRDTVFLRELQQHQIQLLRNPRELETFMDHWQKQHPFYSGLNAERLVRISLCNLLVTRITNSENFLVTP